jgi:ABC-type phosphate transport system substrate-binding protein
MRRLALFAFLALAACSKAPTGAAPHQIHVAGSSAGFLLSTEVAERLMREDPDVLAPLVRAGGTGEGIARFCDKDNPTRPDILITTRKMTAEEQVRCAANGSGDIEQRPIGASAVILVEARGGPSLPGLTRTELASALTSNTKTWAAIRPELPASPILIHGPAPTPGIADTLYGPILQAGQYVRSDGAYVGHGADAALVAQSVAGNPGSVGIIPAAQFVGNRYNLSPIHVTGGGAVSMDEGASVEPTGLLGISLFLVHRPHDARIVPGLTRLLSYYHDALRRPRDDIFRSRAIP